MEQNCLSHTNAASAARCDSAIPAVERLFAIHVESRFTISNGGICKIFSDAGRHEGEIQN